MNLKQIIAACDELEIIPLASLLEKPPAKNAPGAADHPSAILKMIRTDLANAPSLVRLALATEIYDAVWSGNDELAVAVYMMAYSVSKGTLIRNPRIHQIADGTLPAYSNDPATLQPLKPAEALVRFRDWWQGKLQGCGSNPKDGLRSDIAFELRIACQELVGLAVSEQRLPRNWPVDLQTYNKYVPAWLTEDGFMDAVKSYITRYDQTTATQLAHSIRLDEPRGASPAPVGTSTMSPVAPKVRDMLWARGR